MLVKISFLSDLCTKVHPFKIKCSVIYFIRVLCYSVEHKRLKRIWWTKFKTKFMLEHYCACKLYSALAYTCLSLPIMSVIFHSLVLLLDFNCVCVFHCTCCVSSPLCITRRCAEHTLRPPNNLKYVYSFTDIVL